MPSFFSKKSKLISLFSLIISIIVIFLFLFEFNLKTPSFAQTDTTPPAKINNLTVTSCTAHSCTLSWTSPGDDGNTGQASSYELRWNTIPITDSNWNYSFQIFNEPIPKPSGNNESLTVTGLVPNTHYYFAIKAIDEAGNEGELSNLADGTTGQSQIIFEDNFDNSPEWHAEPKPEGYYFEGPPNWDGYSNNRDHYGHPLFNVDSTDPRGGSGKSLRVYYEWEEAVTGGRIFKFLADPHDGSKGYEELYIRWYQKFNTWDWKDTGMTFVKLFRMWFGIDIDEYGWNSERYHPEGVIPDARGGPPTVRPNFFSMCIDSNYPYSTRYRKNHHVPLPEPGEWHCYEFHIKLNSVDSWIKSPTVISATPKTSGGSLPDGTYYYVFTGINQRGETRGFDMYERPIKEISVTISGGGGNGSVEFKLSHSANATGFKVYRSTASGEETLKYIVNGTLTTWTDDGSDTNSSSDTPPKDNTAVPQDGFYEFYLDGEKVFEGKNIKFRERPVKMNCLLLADNMYNPWEKEQVGGADEIDYSIDDVVISTSYVGPDYVIGGFQITTNSLPQGNIGTSYNATLSATGGSPPYTWSIISGNLPNGLSLNSSTGIISGTPTTQGTFNFTIQVKDNENNTATKSLSITINQPDTTPPTRSNGSPTGELPAGTTQITLSLTTNENATCRYSATPNIPYASMTNTFSNTGTTSHSTTITGLSSGNTYNYYIKCIDTSNNANTDDYTISFSIASPGEITTVVSKIKPDCTGESGLCFTSLAAWEEARQGDITASGRNTIEVAECYPMVDTTPVVIDGWKTDAEHYIKIYTPKTARHNGKWDENKYRLVPSSGDAIRIKESNIKIYGLQIHPQSGSGIYVNAYDDGVSYSNLEFAYNIIKGPGSVNYRRGIRIRASADYTVTNVKIWNNIIYDFAGTNAYGIDVSSSVDGQIFVYNNTVYNCFKGIATGHRDTIAKNNLVKCYGVNNSFVDFSGVWENDGFSHNASSDGTADDQWLRVVKLETGTATDTSANKLIDSNAKFQTNGVKPGMRVKNTTDNTWANVTSVDSETQLTLDNDIFVSGEGYEVGATYVNRTFTFVDEANDDFHLASTDDTGAKDYGTDLSSDPNLSFNDDIDGDTRSGTWDIGADERIESTYLKGDLNQDNKVNSSDFQILIQKFKETQNIEIEDLNSDGIVDIKDIGILMHYWNE